MNNKLSDLLQREEECKLKNETLDMKMLEWRWNGEDRWWNWRFILIYSISNQWLIKKIEIYFICND